MRRSLSFFERLKLYPLFIVALMMIAGIIAGSYITLPYNVVLYTLAAFLILALVSYKRLLLRYIFIYVSVFLLGAILYYNAVKEYSLKNESRQNFNAVITSSPSPHGKIVRCDIVVTSGKMKGRKLRASIMRDTIEQRYLLLKVGSGISCNAIVAPAKDFSDGHFSYSRYLVSNSISGTAFVPLYHWKQERVPLSSLSTSDRLRLVASKYRLKLIERYQSSGLSDLSLSLVSAMTLGERSMISKEIRDEFSITGTSHVLAMSGLHLSILYMFLTFAWGRRKRWVLVSFVNIILIWAFVFIAGLPLSLVRSAIMLTTHSVLSVARRDSLSLNTLSLAALIIIIGNPISVYDVGFQMSFSAVLAILLLVPWIIGKLGEKEMLNFPASRLCWSFVIVSCVAQMAVAPLIAYYFGRISCYFLLANLVAIPCTYVILISGMLLLIVPIAPFQSFVANILNATVRFMNDSLAFISSRPGSSFNVEIGAIGVVFYYIVLVAIIAFVYKKYGVGQSKVLS